MALARSITLHMPPRIEIGAGASGRVGPWAEGAARVLVLASPHTSGFADRLALPGEVTIFDAIPGEPDIATFEAALDAARAVRPDLVVGLGGGSVIDAAKAIAVVASNGGRILDYEGVDRVTAAIPPTVMCPTTAGTGADVSQFAVITDTAPPNSPPADSP